MGNESWPLEPLDRFEARSVQAALGAFLKGCLGGAVTLAGLGGLVAPNLLEARGATTSWVLAKQRRDRCLELGLTLEQLAEIEAGQGLEATPEVLGVEPHDDSEVEPHDDSESRP